MDAVNEATDGLLAGRYELRDVIGRGGLGVVYHGWDRVLNRDVAIKMLAEDGPTDMAAAERLTREAQSTAGLVSPHVVQVYDFGTTDGKPYLVMEYLPGGTLAERLTLGEPRSVAEIVDIGRQIAAGLAAAHAKGIVHRDVTLRNVLVAADGRLKLCDFGIAKVDGEPGLTRVGLTVGTASAMAPEQVRGDEVSPATDVYGLGTVLYELATGRPPFEAATSMGVVVKQLEERARPPRDINPAIPTWLDTIITRALSKDAANRFADGGALEAALAVGSGGGQAGAVTAVLASQPAQAATSPMQAIKAAANRGWTAAQPVVARAGQKARQGAATARPVLRQARHDVQARVAAARPVAARVRRDVTRGLAAIPPAVEQGFAPLPPAVERGERLARAGYARARPRLERFARRCWALWLIVWGWLRRTPRPLTAPIARVRAKLGPLVAVVLRRARPYWRQAAGVAALLVVAVLLVVVSNPDRRPASAAIGAGTPAATVVGKPSPAGTPGTARAATPRSTIPVATPTAPVIVAASLPNGGARAEMDNVVFVGGYSQSRGSYYQDSKGDRRTATWIYGGASKYPLMTARFRLAAAPKGDGRLVVTGMDAADPARIAVRVTVNDVVIFEGPSPLPDGTWGEATWRVPASALKAGENVIAIRSLGPEDNLHTPPFFMVDKAEFAAER